jgi:protoheme IX farnesyltransferase
MTSKFSNYVALTKPGLTFVSVSTAVGSAYLASVGTDNLYLLWHLFIGAFIAGGGAGALNQYLERDFDARMTRTGLRPLPANRLPANNVLLFGLILSIIGCIYLAVFTTIVAAVLTAATLIIYLLLYTPMKRRTPFATVIGGIAGALPPLIGWTAMTGNISIQGLSLFFILFFWQTPHFLALAWIHREDYERAGYKVITVVDPTGISATRQVIIYCIALVPASIMPALVGLAGAIYFTGALILSFGYLTVGLILFRDRTNSKARLLFVTSVVYLPALFILMILNRLLH